MSRKDKENKEEKTLKTKGSKAVSAMATEDPPGLGFVPACALEAAP